MRRKISNLNKNSYPNSEAQGPSNLDLELCTKALSLRVKAPDSGTVDQGSGTVDQELELILIFWRHRQWCLHASNWERKQDWFSENEQ